MKEDPLIIRKEKDGYLLNISNQLNRNESEVVTVFDLNLMGGEVQQKQTFPFPVGSEIYIKLKARKGLAVYDRRY